MAAVSLVPFKFMHKNLKATITYIECCKFGPLSEYDMESTNLDVSQAGNALLGAVSSGFEV